ncbi:hypothetical protein ACWCQN_13310 [Streptomyces sp. NPDC001984]
MPSLPPPVWAELFYSGAWNTITDDVRVATSAVQVTRGLSSESSSDAEPTSCTCDLDSRDDRYAPRNPMSPLYGLIGRNTPWRHGYTVGSPWAAMAGGLGSDALETPDAAALDVSGDFDLRLDVALESWAESQMLCLRYIPGSAELWALEMINGFPMFMWSPNGTFASRIAQTCTEELKAYNGQRLALRVTLDINNGAGGYELRFYTGRTVDDTEWNLLGNPIVGASTTSVFPGTAPLEIGCGTAFNALPSGGVLNRLRGKVYALKLLDGTTTKVNMKTSAATAGGTSFVDATGLTWTKQGSAVLSNKHIRMAGEVPAWPPTRDLSLKDNYVSINPSGVMRRMDAGNKPQDSALLRFIKFRSPVECWPLTDGPASVGAKSMVGGSDMRQEILIGEGNTAAAWSEGRLADWIEPTLSVKANTSGYIRGACRRTTGTDAFWSVDAFLSGGGIPSSGQVFVSDRGAGTDADNRVSIQILFTGNLDRLTVIRQSDGDTGSSQALLANIDGVGIYNEDPHHIRLSIDPQASQTLWSLYVDGTLRGSGTINSIVMKSVKDVLLGWGYLTLANITMSDRSFGYLTYWDGSGPSAAEIYAAYMGFQGELAGTRIERLATEAGYTVSVAGEDVYQQPMGIQGQKKLLELLGDANSTNFGYLLEARDRSEVIHRGNSTLWNQPPALTLDFSAGLISAPFKPVDDDKLTENDVSVQREYGSAPGREVLEEGDLSVLDPEQGGVGRYDQAYTYSLYTDDQADQVASMRLHLGTYNGVRYTRLTLNLANERVFQLVDDILRVDVGDKIRLTNLPADHGPDDVDILVAGYSEDAGPDAWTITFNCVPGEPWTAGVTDKDYADTGGCILAEPLNASGTAVDVFTTGLARWVNAGPVLNTNGSFDSGISGWSAFGGATIAWDPVRGKWAPGCLVLTTTGAATPRAEISTKAAVSPGKQYALSGWLHTDVSLGTTAAVAVNWYTAQSGGTFISTSNAALITIPAGTWTWFQGIVTAPATALGAAVLTSLTGTPAAGLVWRADDLELRENVPDTYPDDLPFDVRTGGEVMRVTAATPGVWDTFTRSVTDGWGSTDFGSAWTNSSGAATDYDVNGSAGTHTLTNVDVARVSATPTSGTDHDVQVDIATGALATGGPQFCAVAARHTDVNNMYFAQIEFGTSAAVTLTLRKRVGGTETTLATLASGSTGLTHAASTFFRVRLQAIGSAIRMKAWLASDPEPVTWTLSATDTSLTSGSNVGVRTVRQNANTNTNLVVSFDNFVLLNPQTFTVTRAINGVQKSQPAGQDIRLANPVYVAM